MDLHQDFFTTLQFYPKDPLLLLFFACNIYSFESKIIKTHRP